MKKYNLCDTFGENEYCPEITVKNDEVKFVDDEESFSMDRDSFEELKKLIKSGKI